MSEITANSPSNRRFRVIALSVLALAIAGLFAYYFSTRYEYYEEQVYLGFSLEARSNPFLAAEQFLQQQDIAVSSSTQLQALEELEQQGVLVIFNANSVLNQRSAAQVVEWMQQGGRVIVAAPLYDADEDEDVLLSQFGVTKYWADDGYAESISELEVDENGFIVEEKIKRKTDNDTNRNDDDEKPRNNFEEFKQAIEKSRQDVERAERLNELNQQAAREDWQVDEKIRQREAWTIQENLIKVEFNEVDHPLFVDLSGSGSLYHPALYQGDEEEWSDAEYNSEDENDEYESNDYDSDDWTEEDEYGYESYEHEPFYWVGNDSAVGLMQFEVGEGLLTVMADVNVFTNSQIGIFDHAMLLQALTASAEKVTFLYGADVPGLLELIWEHFFETVIAALAVLGLWVVYRFRRFGPVQTQVDLTRRSFQEHISAVGEYLWRNKLKDTLVDNVRNEIWRALKKRYPGFDRLDEPGKLEKLAEAAEIELAQAQYAMTSKVSEDEIYFYQQIKLLQKLRKKL